MFYEYYQVKDTDNTYLCLILNCKNAATVELGADKVAKISVKCDNKYTYTSFSTIPDDTLGFSYTSLTNIKPLNTKQIYFLAELPKNLADDTNIPIEIELTFEGNTYKCKYR